MDLLKKHMSEIGCTLTNNQIIPIGKKSIILHTGPFIGERHLSVLASKIHGRGLFTGNHIPKGEIIIEYTGEVSYVMCF